MNDNGVSSGRVAPIQIPPHLLKTISISIPFKKLNEAGRVWEILIPAPPRPVPPSLTFFFFLFIKKITFKFFNYIKINIFYK